MYKICITPQYRKKKIKCSDNPPTQLTFLHIPFQ